MLYQKLIALVVDPTGSENDDPFVLPNHLANQQSHNHPGRLHIPLSMQDTIAGRSHSVAAEQPMPSG